MNSLDSIVNIDIKAFGLIVDVSKHNLAITIELGCEDLFHKL